MGATTVDVCTLKALVICDYEIWNIEWNLWNKFDKVVLEILAVDLLGTILDDEQIVVATNQGEPLSGKNSQAEEEYQNICKRILGEDIPFVTIRQKKGMFSRLGSIFRK